MAEKKVESLPTLSYFPLNQPVLPTKNTLEPSITLTWSSNVGWTTAMAVPLLEEVTLAQGVPTPKGASGLNVYRFPGNDQKVALVPVKDVTNENLPLKWTKQSTRAHINFRKLLAVVDPKIPRGSYAQIPVSKGTYPGAGPCLILHFDAIEYHVRATGKRKAGSAGGESVAAAAANG